VTDADPLDAALVDLRERLVTHVEYLAARGLTVSERWHEDDFDNDAAAVIFASVEADVARLMDVIHRLDMARVEVGVRRARKRLG